MKVPQPFIFNDCIGQINIALMTFRLVKNYPTSIRPAANIENFRKKIFYSLPQMILQ